MNHIEQIAAALPEYGLDAILIVSAPGERYAVGFEGEGTVLITRSGCHYFTDSRYIEAAQNAIQTAHVDCVGRGRGHLDLAAQVMESEGLRLVGFESDRVSVERLERWQKTLPCTLISTPDLLNKLRASKDSDELAFLRRSQAITDQAFANLLNFIRPGLTEREVAARLVYELMSLGGSKPSFDPIVAAGPSGSMPHAVPGDRVIERGMFVTLDFGCIYEGYCSDMTRTVAVGTPTDEMAAVYQTVLNAQLAGLSAARAGVPGKQVDAAARTVIDQAGYGAYFGHSLGHSLGLEIHESPNFSPSEETVLPVGAVVSCEPGIYLPGRFGVRIEDVVILREDGCENLTGSSKELLIL